MKDLKERGFLFDDTYSGPRFRYGLTYRSAPWGVPSGFIIFSDREHPDFRFGTIDYPFEIDQRTAEQMDLYAGGANESPHLGTVGEVTRQIGNAVPVQQAAALVRAILEE